MVNVTLKSGTNRVKGEAYEYMRRDRLSSTDFFVKKAGTAETQGHLRSPRAFSLGGPVVIPGLYDGHDRTFAFGAVEWLYDEFPEPARARCRRWRCAKAIFPSCSRRTS